MGDVSRRKWRAGQALDLGQLVNLQAQPGHLGMSDLCVLAPSAMKLLCLWEGLQGNVQSSRCEKCSGEWSVNTRSHQPPPQESAPGRTSWALAWEVSFLHPSQLSASPREGRPAAREECLPPAPTRPPNSHRQAGFLKPCLPSCLQASPWTLRLTLTPLALRLTQPDLFSRRCRVGPSCFPLCRHSILPWRNSTSFSARHKNGPFPRLF